MPSLMFLYFPPDIIVGLVMQYWNALNEAHMRSFELHTQLLGLNFKQQLLILPCLRVICFVRRHSYVLPHMSNPHSSPQR